ncbi:MAG: ATP-binding protein [Methanosarcinaceae archaeon]|nr:ATP-binding protein [Methanosarcinaceae archaeon]
MVNVAKNNLHWREGFTYGYGIKRDLFGELVRYLDARPVIGIIGLRRTGKTVLLKQVMDHLVDQGTPRDQILYFSFDEEVASIDEVMLEFQSRIGRDISGAGNVYVFLDEIQKLEGWQNQVKYYYDTYPEIKFFVSGSSSIFLKKKSEESLAGRIFLYHLPVLRFSEFLRLKGEDDLIKRPEMFREALGEQMHLYIKRQLPELVTAEESFIDMYLESIVSKMIYEDLPMVFPIEYPDVLRQILRIVADSPGIITDYAALANDLNISRKTITKYISYLERGFLIQKCYNFSKNRLTTEKKMKRLYLSNSTLLFHLREYPDFGRIAENIVINSAEARFFWRRGTSEVDCIQLKDDQIVPVESKYRNNIQKKDIKGLMKFLEKFSVDTGYVVTKNIEAEERIDDKRIIFIPLWKWLLCGTG